jgi:tight adherence protein B
MLESLSRLPAEVAAVVVVLMAALVVLAWSLHSMMVGDRAKLKRRLAAIAGAPVGPPRRLGLKAARRKSLQSRLRQSGEGGAKGRGDRLREELMMAGLRVELWQYVTGSSALALAVGLVAGVVLGLGTLWGVALGAVFGLGLPKLVVSVAARRRLNRFTGQFAEALDTIVRGIRSGLPLGECLNMVGREMGDPIGNEFRLVTEGQKIGLSLQEALARAVDRLPTPELRYFSIVIAIQQQTGGNLAETLAKLSDVLRARKRMRDKVQAYASEARASAYIIGSLPLVVTILLALVAPAYIGLLFTTDVGKTILAVGSVTELVGLLVMRRMVNFDI